MLVCGGEILIAFSGSWAGVLHSRQHLQPGLHYSVRGRAR